MYSAVPLGWRGILWLSVVLAVANRPGSLPPVSPEVQQHAHQVVPLPMSDAAAVDPEEAFVASLSSCHLLWFLDIACRAGWVVDDYDDAADGVMAKNADGRLAMTVVTLRPRVRFAGVQPSREQVEALHHRAHEACFIASSVRTEVRCEPVHE